MHTLLEMQLQNSEVSAEIDPKEVEEMSKYARDPFTGLMTDYSGQDECEEECLEEQAIEAIDDTQEAVNES